jgi:hypothetical protein
MSCRLAFALLLSVLLAGQAAAQPGGLPPPPIAHAPHGCHEVPIEKTVSHTDVLLVPHEHATTLPAWKLRDVEVGRLHAGPVLEFKEEKQCVTVMELRERDVVKQVTVMESRPIQVTCPTTGACHTEYQMCPVVKTVKQKVAEVVPVQRQVVVRVPVLKPGGEVIVKQVVVDQLTVPAIKRTFDGVPTHNELTVPVQPCPPLGCPHHP